MAHTQTREAGAPQGPLAGVRVLDLSNFLAGPLSTMYLADFGADVIKVEAPGRGDEIRMWGRRKNGVGLYWKMIARGKRSITLDLRKPLGQAIARRLAAEADVLVENFRPGTLEKWGLGWADLERVNPRLIVLRVTGFGQTGPYAHRPGFGTLAEAYAGAASITGYPDRPPLLPAFGLADNTAGIFGAFAIMVALYQRDLRGGTGQVIDLPIYEPLFTLLGPQVVDYDQLGVVQERAGSRLPFTAPRNTYRTKDDQWVAIGGSAQSIFERILAALDIPHVARDPRFLDNQLRCQHVEALDAIIQREVEKRTLEEILRGGSTPTARPWPRPTPSRRSSRIPTCRPGRISPRSRIPSSARSGCKTWCRACWGRRAASATRARGSESTTGRSWWTTSAIPKTSSGRRACSDGGGSGSPQSAQRSQSDAMPS